MASRPPNHGIISYPKMASVGYMFGPSFQTLEKVWRDDDTGNLLAKIKVPVVEEDERKDEYIVHPCILDAMLQAVLMQSMGKEGAVEKMAVPIKIGKFIWLGESLDLDLPENCYVYSYTEEGKVSVSLLNSKGTLLALISSIELTRITKNALDSALSQQTCTMPDLWEQVWRPTCDIGPMQYRVKFDEQEAVSEKSAITTQLVHSSPARMENATLTINLLNDLAFHSMLRSLYDCGWSPKQGQVFDEMELFRELNIIGAHRKYFGFMMQVLQREGLIEQQVKGSDFWKVVTNIKPIEEVNGHLSQNLFAEKLARHFQSAQLFTNIGKNLTNILLGKETALNIAFSKGESNGEGSALKNFYNDYSILAQSYEGCELALGTKLTQYKSVMNGEKFILRILEIGAGTGGITKYLLNTLEQFNIEYEYTFTDLSVAFFSPAEKRFEKWREHIKFKKLNIEQDPLDQGFLPEYYDYVLANDVIHATKNIRESLLNVSMLIKPFGTFHLDECIDPSTHITFLFGLMDGYWRFEDFDLRPNHCLMSSEMWEFTLKPFGLHVNRKICSNLTKRCIILAEKVKVISPQQQNSLISYSTAATWLFFNNPDSIISQFLLDQLKFTNRRVVTVEAGQTFHLLNENDSLSFVLRKKSKSDFVSLWKYLKTSETKLEGIIYCWSLDPIVPTTIQDEILKPLFYATSEMLHIFPDTRLIRFFVFTKHAVKINVNVVNVAAEHNLSQYGASTVSGFIKSLQNEHANLSCRHVNVAYDSNDKMNLKQLFYEIWNKENESHVGYTTGKGGGGRRICRLKQHIIPTNHKSLTFQPGTDRFQLVLPESNMIADLKFGPMMETKQLLGEKEVEVQVEAWGLNFRDLLTVLQPSFSTLKCFGSDFSGVVNRIGTQVTKWKKGDLVCGINFSSTLPSHLIALEDHVVPVPHSATLCEAATLPLAFATVFLSLVDIAKVVKQDVVLVHTASGGVGLVAIQICKNIECTIIGTAGSGRKRAYLNSLGINHIFNSRNTEYEREILKVTGGKGVTVVLNSLTGKGFKEATLRACAQGARFVEMSKMSIWQPEQVAAIRPDVEYNVVDMETVKEFELQRLMNELRIDLEKKLILPIPYVRFDGLHVREALEFMQNAKHIGKIVCVAPQFRYLKGKMSVHTPLFNERSSYLITGGLGGIGFEVCKWMLENGAKHVIVAGRKPPSVELKKIIGEINSKGANVTAVQLDVGDLEETRELITTRIDEMGLPQLRGIMHAAGKLSDGSVSKLDWDCFSVPFRSKIEGALNLHKVTEGLNLEHFVMFSSFAVLIGLPGQSNHTAANFFMDSLTHFRDSIGLAATTVNWGQWGETGVASEIVVPSTKPLSNLQCFHALEYLLKFQHTQMAVLKVESFSLLTKLFPSNKIFLEQMVRMEKGGNSSTILERDNEKEFWDDYDSAMSLEEKMLRTVTLVKNVLKSIMKLTATDAVEDNMDFQEMGLDSLMFVELANILQTILGKRQLITVTILRDHSSVLQLSERLVNLMEKAGNLVEESGTPTHKQVNDLIRKDCELPAHISATNSQPIKEMGKVKTVLLLGSTGTLGCYLLREFTNNPQITKVICIIRGKKNTSAFERLHNILEGKELLGDIQLEKVKCIEGTVVSPHFGLNLSTWNDLAQEVDAVINCAAQVNYLELYKERNSTTDMRAVNVLGTKICLEFACAKRLKFVYHASSLLAATKIDHDGHLSEDWPEIEDFDGATLLGYPVSKFVSDVLIKEAVKRGIPCKSFRFPLIMGDSRSGRFSLENNHFMVRYIFIMKNGMMPSTPLPLPMLPVDQCAKISLALFFHDNNNGGDHDQSDLYNIQPPIIDLDQEFTEVASRFGYNVKLVGDTEFSQNLQKWTTDKFSFEIFKDLYSSESYMLQLNKTLPLLTLWSKDNELYFISKKVSKILPDAYKFEAKTMEYCYKNLVFAKSQGWF